MFSTPKKLKKLKSAIPKMQEDEKLVFEVLVKFSINYNRIHLWVFKAACKSMQHKLFI